MMITFCEEPILSAEFSRCVSPRTSGGSRSEEENGRNGNFSPSEEPSPGTSITLSEVTSPSLVTHSDEQTKAEEVAGLMEEPSCIGS